MTHSIMSLVMLRLVLKYERMTIPTQNNCMNYIHWKCKGGSKKFIECYTLDIDYTFQGAATEQAPSGQ